MNKSQLRCLIFLVFVHAEVESLATKGLRAELAQSYYILKVILLDVLLVREFPIDLCDGCAIHCLFVQRMHLVGNCLGVP